VHQNVAWIGDSASFEASLREAPQDEEVLLMRSKAFLMLRSAPFETPLAAAPQDRLARLEARTASVL
jgi:hypothetical protein